MNFNSSLNQTVVKNFVAEHIRAMVTTLMEEFLQLNLHLYEEVENSIYYEIEGEEMTAEEKNEYIQQKEQLIEKYEEELGDYEQTIAYYNKCTKIEALKEFKAIAEYTNPERVDIFEWHIVTKFLARKLSKQGECVLEYGTNFFWGRTCTGQSVYMDYCVGKVCSDLEILEGQKNYKK